METGTVERRLPGAILIGATAIMITGAAIGFLAPSLRDAPPFVTDDVASVATAIAGNPVAWQLANGLIFIAAILTALGLVAISLRFEGNARPVAFVALLAYVFAATFAAIDRMLTMTVGTWAAEQYPDPTASAVIEAFAPFGGALCTAFAMLAYIAVGLYGIAMQRSGGVDGLGWLFVGIGGLGILLELVGLGIPGFVFLATAGVGAASWQIGAKPSQAAQPS